MSTNRFFNSISIRLGICVLITATMILTACAGNDKKDSAATTEEKTEAVSKKDGNKDEAATAADTEAATTESTTVSAADSAESTSEDERAWAQAYLDYLDGEQDEEGIDKSYALIYVDGDDIPELVVDTGFEAGGCQILTWHGGLLDVLQTSRLYFQYIEKGNLLDNCEGHMGYYYDLVYTIHDGRWVQIFNGEYSEFDPASDPDDDFNEETGRYTTLYYSVNGKDTDEKTYYKELDKVFDRSSSKEVTSYLLIDDLRSYLKTGKMIYEDHRYELVVEDCTWEEAQEKCQKKGGYLASLTCDGEFEKVENMIRSEDKTNICFYVGAEQVDYVYEWTEPGLTQKGCVGSPYYKHWLDNGPSYTDIDLNGNTIDEEKVEFIFRKGEDCFYLNDIPNDVIGIYPSFAGKMGYICEYDR